jgi:hypothetical protein
MGGTNLQPTICVVSLGRYIKCGIIPLPDRKHHNNHNAEDCSVFPWPVTLHSLSPCDVSRWAMDSYLLAVSIRWTHWKFMQDTPSGPSNKLCRQCLSGMRPRIAWLLHASTFREPVQRYHSSCYIPVSIQDSGVLERLFATPSECQSQMQET